MKTDISYLFLSTVVLIMGIGFIGIGIYEIKKKKTKTKRGNKITGIATQILGALKIALGVVFMKIAISAYSL